MQQADGTNTYRTSPHIAITSNFVDDVLNAAANINRGNSGANSSGNVGNRGSDNGITIEQVDSSVSLYKYSSTNLTTLLLESGNISGNEDDVDNSIITSMPYHLSSSPGVLCNYNNFINDDDDIRGTGNYDIPDNINDGDGNCTSDEGNQADVEGNSNSNNNDDDDDAKVSNDADDENDDSSNDSDSINAPHQLLF
ncbi:hypothetical protein FRACYDRAFT_246866 [Fragilariopsis cylindrus CCMP1102]|uniref:Uncharacterized protein n=1 Tax=Fragilariopsis cylindrus CCMP1102 TaxID=635003 RepID=A0A1E7EWP6_9STRA|nr:hypothetical protein FRACYDRAFT_246866 [Fragilariopsis cylindrus CCMP1102]|eukprot:OEU10458.1 hypothetical protein FRACYDRAFT_246866 [Fragilariopsis cylindrus CCMP1102]